MKAGAAASPPHSSATRHFEFGASPDIGVIILTRGRRRSLRHAVRSALTQDYPGRVQVLVVADRVRGQLELADGRRQRPSRVDVAYVWPRTVALTAVEHVARLRNLALTLVDAPLVAFLDDDNAWDPNHLSSLYACLAKSDAVAAHSWRRLVDRQGHEAAPARFPWLLPGAEERETYAVYCHLGVLRPGDAVVKDVASVCWRGKERGMVDLGEWLFRRDMLSALSFATTYTPHDLFDRVGEDDKLLAAIRARQLPVVCSEQPTVHYRLGGFSNR